MDKKRFIWLLIGLLAAVFLPGACEDGDDFGDNANDPLLVQEPQEPDEAVEEMAPIGDEPIPETPAAGEAIDETMIDRGEHGVTGIEDGLMLASTLINRSIRDTAGEAFADIQNLLIDAQSGHILFARVGRSGPFPTADEEILVPLSTLQWDGAEEDFVFTLDEDVFANWTAQGGGMPSINQPGWDEELVVFWQGTGVDLFWEAGSLGDSVLWVSGLIDDFVIEFNEDTLLGTMGTINDLIVDLSQSRARYVLVAFDPGLYGPEPRAIPFNTFNVTIQPNDFVHIAPGISAAEVEAAPPFAAGDLTGVTVFDDGVLIEQDAYWGNLGFDVH